MKFDVRAQFRIVAEDLEHLRDEWLLAPRNDVIRRGSVVLRRLLAEGVLQRAWKEFGFSREPSITAPRLESLIEIHKGNIVSASAGGARDNGIEVACSMSFRNAPAQDDGAFAPEYAFRLKEFTESASIVVADHVLRRREVIKYFAHLEGGAHLRLSARVRRDEEDLVRTIEGWVDRVHLLERDALYFELLSIGQSIARAEDVHRLLATIRSELPT
jgi:hypothetical protein